MSEIPETEFLTRLGLSANPFAETDADKEDRLADYFVPPPYFDAVFGNPARPTSTVVFAPRGAGKSAQRRMVELKADPSTVLTVTYTDFPMLPAKAPNQVTIDDHLDAIVRHSLLGILARLGVDGSANKLVDSDRRSLQMLASIYLEGLTHVEVEASIDALRNWSDRVRQFYSTFTSVYNQLGPAVLQQLGIPVPQLPVLNDFGQPIVKSAFTDYQVLGRIAKAIGFQAVYVLVDRVDETSSTANDVEAAYGLVAPLLSDLRVQQVSPYCMKFFLPVDLEPLHRSSGRPDRLEQFTLNWTPTEIEKVLVARLRAYSGGRVTSLIQILDQPGNIKFVEQVVARLAEESPRDLIRLLRTILAEEMRRGETVKGITSSGLLAGMNTFCEQRASEIVRAPMLQELRRLRRVDFTINEIAAEVFKKRPEAVSNRIRNWEAAGVVTRVPDARRSDTRPANRYAFTDSRVARVVAGGDILDFVNNKMASCPSCNKTVLRDWDEYGTQICRCGREFSA